MPLPPPPTNPAAAFGEGDPRNAKYFETLANLEHQYQTSLGSSKEARTNARANALYNRGLIGQREPQSYKANTHRANAGGLLESGVNAERRGTIGQEYANKRFSVVKGLQEREGSLSAGEQRALEDRELGRGNAATSALGEGYKALMEQQLMTPEPATAAAVNPGGVRTITGPAEAGGVVPYREKTPGGSVAVGSATRLAREAAARRAAKR